MLGIILSGWPHPSTVNGSRMGYQSSTPALGAQENSFHSAGFHYCSVILWEDKPQNVTHTRNIMFLGIYAFRNIYAYIHIHVTTINDKRDH